MSLPRWRSASPPQRAKGVDVISLGIGSPDLAPPQVHHRRAVSVSAQRADTHGYAGYYGTPALRQAIATYYGRRFGVELDPASEVRAADRLQGGPGQHGPGLCRSRAIVVLASDPGYPTYRMGALMAGGEFYSMPLLRRERLSARFRGHSGRCGRKRATLMWLNYPNNPTGVGAPLEFLREAVDFCREYDIC